MLKGVRNGVNRAGVKAINDVAKSSRADLTRRLSAATGLKQKDVRARIGIRLANFKRMVAHLFLSARPIPLIRFGARQTKEGVTYKVSKTNA